MKELYQVILVLVAGGMGLVLHDHYSKEAANRARLEARAEAQAEAAAAAEAQQAKASALRKVEISRNLEKSYTDLLADLNQANPVDLVPTLSVIRERLRDKRIQVEAARQPIYDAGDALLVAMIDTGEERTSALQSLLQAAERKNVLEKQGSLTSTAAFFAQGAVKKWADERSRRKPGLDQLMGQLRQMEREWNQRTTAASGVDSFDSPNIPAARITVDATVSANSLERGAYNQDRPWRRYYYDSTGYRYYYRYRTY